MSEDAGPEEPAASRGHEYEVTVAGGAHGVLVGDGSTQVNIEHLHVTWTDGVAPEPLVATSGEVASPYRGLDAFGEPDAAFFFGRDAAVDEMLGRMADRAGETGLLVLSGASGAGKTSLLRAGVLPRLRVGGLPGIPEAAAWPCVVLVPGPHPLEELAVRIAPAARADAGAVRRSLGEDASGFALTVRQAAAAADASRVLLIVDQFETVLTQCERAEERAAFVAALDAAATSRAAVVVIAIRADLEAKLADFPEFPALRAAVQDRYLLGAMTDRQLRLAITRPAVAVRSSVDEDLVAELLRNVRAHASRSGGEAGPIGAGVLPLLSHALDQAWRSRAAARGADGTIRPLTLADYEATGGIERAVRDSAQSVFDGLTSARQQVARQVFVRLTATTPEGIDTAVRVTTTELLAGRDESGAADVTEVLGAFARERLLTLAAGSVEISHEVLLSAWPLLRDDWLAGTRADRAARARLQATVTDWIRAGHDRSFLYRGKRLDAESQAAARIRADGRHIELSPDELAFLAQSRQAQTHTTRVRRAIIGGGAMLAAGLAVALVIATQSAGGYLRERGNAEAAQRSAAVASSNAAVARSSAATESRLDQSDADARLSLSLESTDPVSARDYAVTSWRLAPTSQSRYALLAAASNPLTDVIPGSPAAVSVAVSPDGTILAVGYSDGVSSWVQLYDSRTGSPIGGKLTTPGLSLPPVTFSSGLGGPVSLSPVALPPDLADSGTGNPLLPLAFDPSGKTLAVGAGDSMALWDVRTRRTSATFPLALVNGIDSVAFSPDGKTLLVGGESCTGQLFAVAGCAELWNAATGADLGAPVAADGRVSPGYVVAAFSPDGTTVATAGSTGTVQLWNAATHRQTGPAFPASRTAVEALAFSPGGGTLVTGGDDGTVRFWNTATGAAGRVLTAGTGTGDQVNAVAFSRSGALVAAADQDGTVRIWNAATGQQVGPDLSAGTDPGTGVAFSPGDISLASADTDGTARQWSLAALEGHPAAPAIQTGADGGGIGAVALGPSGRVVTSDDGGDVSVWSGTIGNQYSQVGILTSASPDPADVPQIAVSPDGRWLATSDDDGTIRLWNLSSPGTTRPAATIPVPQTVDDGNLSLVGGIVGLAFSPDGKEFAAAYAQGDVQVFDTATGRPVGASFPADFPLNGLLALAFAPAGGELITVDATGAVTTWNPRAAETGDEIGTPVITVSFGNQPDAAALSPDAQTLAVGYPDGTVQLWDIATNEQIGNPIVTGDGDIQSLSFGPDGTRLASAGADGTVRLWDVSYLSPARDLAG